MATAVQLRRRLPATMAVRSTHGTTTRGASIAQGLGWFSIGLGLAQVVAPRSIARLIGVDDDSRTIGLMRAIGMRELASGFGILSQRSEGKWLWGRVAGDAMDFALLGAAMRSTRSSSARTMAAAAAVLGVTVLDAMTARRRSRDHHRDEAELMGDDAPEVTRQVGGVRHVKKSITIDRPVEEVVRCWENVSERPGILRRLGEAAVSIEPGPRDGTEVRVELTYEPGNKLRFLVARLKHSDPAQQLEVDLRHLKQLVEIGEIVHSDASIHRGLHPAQPSGEAVDA